MKRARDRERAEKARRARQRRRRSRRERLAQGQTILQALTTSTLALPGLAGAETASDQYSAEYSFARYSEHELSDAQVTLGSETERYEIDIHQLRLAVPINNRLDLSVDVAYETMTGATPWYVAPPNLALGEDSPRVQMTGASIDDTRTDVMLGSTYYMDRSTASGGLGVSIENDYQAYNISLSGTRDFNEKNTTLSGGLGFSYDLIDPTDGGIDGRPSSEEKQTLRVSGGLSQVLTRHTAIQSTLTYQFGNGFLSDPYKLAWVAGTPIQDNRPDQRHQLSWLTRYRTHFERVGGSLHFDYNLFFDDWGINAHTFDAAWYQNVFGILRLIPSVRYYSQSQADFYAPYYQTARGDGLASSDYRLSPYGALSYRVRAETRFQIWKLDWIANIGWETYESSADLALKSVGVENPGLVSFDLWSVGLTTRF